ncbi:hypothetical protein C8259_34035 [Nocardia nova]|uniref:Uncharacterized protein n=1 Tax=Nocardia nova TaxID=37330 RepID=A0A2T2YQ63_9NOCA|nr:hypothetical protein C8259_34035 [Nocardia nova]
MAGGGGAAAPAAGGASADPGATDTAGEPGPDTTPAPDPAGVEAGLHDPDADDVVECSGTPELCGEDVPR